MQLRVEPADKSHQIGPLHHSVTLQVTPRDCSLQEGMGVIAGTTVVVGVSALAIERWATTRYMIRTQKEDSDDKVSLVGDAGI